MIDAHFERLRPHAMRKARLLLALPFALVLSGSAAGCSGGDKVSGAAVAKAPSSSRSETLDHESCDEGGHRVESLDTNNDGKPDIRRMFDGSGHEKCRTVDLNHD